MQRVRWAHVCFVAAPLFYKLRAQSAQPVCVRRWSVAVVGARVKSRARPEKKRFRRREEPRTLFSWWWVSAMNHFSVHAKKANFARCPSSPSPCQICSWVFIKRRARSTNNFFNLHCNARLITFDACSSKSKASIYSFLFRQAPKEWFSSLSQLTATISQSKVNGHIFLKSTDKL